MFGIDFGFVHPWYLALLLLLPLLWVFSFRSLSGLGRYRRLFALAFRTLVFVLIVLALAEVQTLRTSDKVTVTYLLDQSESIPIAQRQAMLDYVRQGVRRHRRAERAFRLGALVFQPRGGRRHHQYPVRAMGDSGPLRATAFLRRPER